MGEFVMVVEELRSSPSLLLMQESRSGCHVYLIGVSERNYGQRSVKQYISCRRYLLVC